MTPHCHWPREACLRARLSDKRHYTTRSSFPIYLVHFLPARIKTAASGEASGDGLSVSIQRGLALQRQQLRSTRKSSRKRRFTAVCREAHSGRLIKLQICVTEKIRIRLQPCIRQECSAVSLTL